jgi:hypothetical protein
MTLPIVWDDDLEPMSDAAPDTRLLGMVTIAGVLHHVDMIAVAGHDGDQAAVDPAFQHLYEFIAAYDSGGRFMR